VRRSVQIAERTKLIAGGALQRMPVRGRSVEIIQDLRGLLPGDFAAHFVTTAEGPAPGSMVPYADRLSSNIQAPVTGV